MTRNYTERIFGNLGEARSDAANCPICGAPWDFQTDWLGGLHEVHPVTRCVPKPAPAHVVECGACARPIRLEADPGRRTVFWCSMRCHEALLEAKRERDAANSKKYLAKQKWLKKWYGDAA